MATTTYAISVQTIEGDFEQVETKAKKATAIERAQAIRLERKATVQVHTGNGTLVFEMKARKPQRKTKPYTRVVALPEGFKVPEGKRVAYLRTRKNCAILHDFDEQYWVYGLATNEVLASFGTTRQCGRFLADSVSVNDAGVAVVAE